MSKKFYLLICVLFAFGGVAHSEEFLDVNNYSFELDCDGNQILVDRERMWVEGECVLGWVHSPLDGWAAAVPDSYNGMGATDGVVNFWIHTDVTVWQVTENVFEEAYRYYLRFDSQNWDTECQVSFFYPEDVAYPDANHIEVASELIYIDTPLPAGPNGWGYDYEMVFTSLPGQDYIGKPLGIKFYNSATDDNYWFLDNIRLSWEWATTAYEPNPEDGSDEADKDVVLEWRPGVWAANTDGHHVYFGTSFEEVHDAGTSTPDIYRGTIDVGSYPDPCDGSLTIYTYDPPETLELIKTYYWRIDEVNEAYSGTSPAPGPWKGDVWSFEVEGRAKEPNPADGATGVSPTLELSWTAGRDALSHDVYFGTDYNSVTDANTSSGPDLYRGNQLTGTETYTPTEELIFGVSYYWRIDEVSASKVCKGYTWSFTINDHEVVDDMESYGLSINKIEVVWEDYWINDTGAEVYLNTDANFSRDDNSMFYEYDNMYKGAENKYGSVAEASISNLEIGSDWTAGGAKGLVLYFYGQEDNSATVNDRMYVALSDGTDVGVMYHPDVNTLTEEEWHEWNIDFEDFNSQYVDMTNVSKIAIGFGVYGGSDIKGGKGEVYIDSIGAYPARCVPSFSALYGDSDGDCIVEGIDLSAIGRDWLESSGLVVATAPDANRLQAHYRFEEGLGYQFTANEGVMGSGYDGMLGNTDVVDACDPQWIISDPCAEHMRCLEFDGTEHVEIPPFNFNTDTLTITAWIQRDKNQEIFAGIVAATDPDPNTHTKAALQFGSTPDWKVTNTLNYTWSDDGSDTYPYTWQFESNLLVPDGLWTFVAVTVEPTEGILYMYDGSEMQSAKNLNNYHYVEEFDSRTDIGWSRTKGPGKRHFVGRIDDVHIYDYTLSAAEILYLADPVGSYYHSLEDWRMDVDGSGAVDFGDFAVLADNWMTEILWP